MAEDIEGAPQPQQRAQTARGREGAGDGPRAPTAHRPSLDKGRDPPVWQCALPVHGMPKQEKGNLPRQEEEEGLAPPEQHALPAHGMQGRGRPPNPTIALRRPPEQRAHPAHGMQGRGGDGGYNIPPKGEGGGTP